MSDSPSPFAVGAMGAAIANTAVVTPIGATTNIREDLADIVYLIDPDEVPMVSAIGSRDAHAVQTDWTVQALGAADVNAQPEGFRFAAQAATKPARYSNICQIMARSVTVSNTYGATDTVGGDEFDRQTLLKAKEAKRDLEYAFTRGTVKKLTDPRNMSGILTWITNGSMGAGTGTMPVGDGSNAPVAGTARTMTLDLINDGLEQAFNAGGTPTLALMGSKLKRAFSALAQGGTGNPIVAQNIVSATSAGEVTIVGAVSVFLSDFGRIQLAPDRFMPTTDVIVLDVDYVENAPLPGRDMIQEEYAKAGDARDGAVVYEGTLRVTAPKAHAHVGDLTP